MRVGGGMSGRETEMKREREQESERKTLCGAAVLKSINNTIIFLSSTIKST